MPTQRKVDTVEALTDKLNRTQLAVVADYRGMTVAEMADMRAKMREHGAEVIVAKNTLLKIAARNSERQVLESLLEGPTAIAFAYDDVAKFARAMNSYLKEMPKIQVRGSLLGASVLPADGLADVEKLPSREEVLGQILGGIVSPLTGFMGMLDAPARDIVTIIDKPATEVVGLVGAVTTEFSGVLQARINQLQQEQGTAS
jgi:large subunit ribosomal protein L10